MKNDISGFIKIIIAFIVGLACCMGLFYLVDTLMNGSFVDWFTDTFMYISYETDFQGNTLLNNRIDWSLLKNYLFMIMIFGIGAVALIAMTASYFYARKQQKRTIAYTSGMIQEYMGQDGEATDIFPADYALLAAQMVQIKSTMQRHEQILKEEASRKNDLIAYLAHDLKTPLTSVIGYLSLLDEAADMPPAQREKYIHITLDKANRLEALINEFFDITRYNLQQIVLEKGNIDLYYMLVQMVDEFYPIVTAHRNTIKLTADENLEIYGDSNKLARVFNNILKNAITYSYPDTEIHITAQMKDKQLQISFENKGKTIPKQKLELIFEKFFRMDDARSTNNGGAGLGLAIAKEIVMLHGGTITAESENEKICFCVLLPAGQEVR